MLREGAKLCPCHRADGAGCLGGPLGAPHRLREETKLSRGGKGVTKLGGNTDVRVVILPGCQERWTKETKSTRSPEGWVGGKDVAEREQHMLKHSGGEPGAPGGTHEGHVPTRLLSAQLTAAHFFSS